MKVTTLGSVGTFYVPPWYLTQEQHCPRCGARWFLELGDNFTLSAERTPNGDAWTEVECPTPGCNTIVETYRTRANGGRAVGTRDAR